ncbi:MAG: hypothetical protein ACKVW3_16045 [Phycisphaerales bacterium]
MHEPPRSDVNPAGFQRLRRQREMTDVLLSRAESLPPQDSALIRAILGDGKPAREVAILLGLPPGGDRAIRRRVRRLITRMTSTTFIFVLRHGGAWPPPLRRVATACFLHGLSLRAAARELGTSLHSVRAAHAAVLALATAATTVSATPREAA